MIEQVPDGAWQTCEQFPSVGSTVTKSPLRAARKSLTGRRFRPGARPSVLPPFTATITA
jgi:hypothetical protein